MHSHKISSIIARNNLHRLHAGTAEKMSMAKHIIHVTSILMITTTRPGDRETMYQATRARAENNRRFTQSMVGCLCSYEDSQTSVAKTARTMLSTADNMSKVTKNQSAYKTGLVTKAT